MDINSLDWQQIELLCGRLLQEEGYTITQHTGRPGTRDYGVDYIANSPTGKPFLIQVKVYKKQLPASLIKHAINQLETGKNYYNIENFLLITTGFLSPKSKAEMQALPNLNIWDISVVESLLDKHQSVKHDFYELEAKQGIIKAKLGSVPQITSSDLIKRLEQLSKGKKAWGEYEELCTEIITYIFVPPFNIPKIQSRSDDGLDIRDAIYPIGASANSFWQTLMSQCKTRSVVAEFKNYNTNPGQKAVESIQQYLYPKAMRSVGFLCSRFPYLNSAIKARRRAWLESDKLIVLLTDDDLKELILSKEAGNDPEEIINAQLDDFFSTLTP